MQIVGMESSVQQATEKRLNLWLGVCGCQAGALFALAALAWCVWGPAQAFDPPFNAVLYGCAIVIGAGVVGKVLTVLSARAMFIADASFFAWRIKRAVQQRRLTT